MRRSYAFILLGVLVLAAAGFALALSSAGLPGAAPVSVEAAATARGPGSVGALGRVEPRSEIINLGGASTDVLIDLSVGRGSTVKRGETIGHFRGYEEAMARANATQRQLDEARAQRAAEAALGQARIQAAQAQLDGITAIGPARIAAQDATIRSLSTKLANDIDILNGRQTLFRTEAGSRRLLVDQRSLVDYQQADLEAARARRAELVQQYAADRANATIAVTVERTTTARAQAQVPVDSLEQQVALARAQAVTASLVAPIEGTVLNVLVHPGEAVGAGPILMLGDTAVMVAVAEVYETDVPRIRLGDRATVSSPALQGPLAGKVVEIGRMVYKNDVLNVDPAARTDARVVQVRVALDDGAAVAGLTNLSVDVAIDAGPARRRGAGEGTSAAR